MDSLSSANLNRIFVGAMDLRAAHDEAPSPTLVVVGCLGVAVALIGMLFAFWDATRPFAWVASLGFLMWWIAGRSLRENGAESR